MSNLLSIAQPEGKKLLLIHTFGVLSSIEDVLEKNSKLAAKASPLVGVEPTEQTRCCVCGM